jgi:hypothetical protein
MSLETGNMLDATIAATEGDGILPLPNGRGPVFHLAAGRYRILSTGLSSGGWTLEYASQRPNRHTPIPVRDRSNIVSQAGDGQADATEAAFRLPDGDFRIVAQKVRPGATIEFVRLEG